MKAHGRWLTIGWLVEGAALLWAADRVKQRLLRVLALVCLALGLAALVTVNPITSATPIFNARFGTYCVAIAVFAFTAWLAMKPRPGEAESFSQAWPAIGAAAVLAVNALILLAVSLEIFAFWWVLPLERQLARV